VADRIAVRRGARSVTGGDLVTPRERDVLSLAATGMTTHEIAVALALSDLTVNTHVRNAIRKLGAHNRTHAVALAVARNEIALGA
jgi:DNA-binding CsgD family transcriptional regulator